MSSKERTAALRKRVAKDPYDAQAWESLVSEADRARRGPERDAALSAVYEDLLNVFPTAAGYWREYADHQMSCSDEGVVKSVFSRCLLTCLSVDLWRSYLNFIKRLNEPRGAGGLAEIRQAYEFTLDRLGQDSACGGIWLDYIAFLQAPKQGSPEYVALYGEALEGQEESQKVAAVRRAYQRALLVPSPQLEGLWRGFEGSEMAGSNKQLARRLLDEWRPQYQAARTLLKEREARLGAINLRALALPPGRGGFTQQQQAALWREYLDWERSNPQHLDSPTYAARVALAFEQALMVLFHYPDVWLEFAAWHRLGGGSGTAAAAAVLEKGRNALPSALALHFAAADLQESLGNVTAAKAIYEKLVEHLKPAEEAAAGAVAPPAATASPAAPPAATPASPTQPAGATVADDNDKQQAAEAATVVEQLQQQASDNKDASAQADGAPNGAAEQEVKEEAHQEPDSPAADSAAQAAGAGAEQVPLPPSAPPPQLQQAEVKPEIKVEPKAEQQGEQQAGQHADIADVDVPASEGLQLSLEQGTLAWVQYMRFTKRTQGIMAARKLFMRARKWGGMRWQAYAASALMEWRHEAKDTIPRNIFELGLKSHMGEPDLVLAYAQFLLGLGDIPNTRALFERALNATAPEAAAPLWDAYVAFEYDVGTLAAAAAVEQRRTEAAAALREAAAAAAAGAALDSKTAAAAAAGAAQQQGPQHEALRLALLKYQVQGLFPASDAQRLYMERLLGQAPALEAPGEARAREPDSNARRERSDRDREKERGERDRGETRRQRDRSPSPPRRGGTGSHAPRSPPRDAEPIRLSRELAQLLNQLPPLHKLEGPLPDVERVVQVILNADLSPDGIIAHEIAAARERRRQRRLAEMGGSAPGGAGGQPPAGGYGAAGGPPGGGGGGGQKRKALQEFDSGSDSEEEQGYEQGGAAGAPSTAADGGLDIYRMRRKQQRGM